VVLVSVIDRKDEMRITLISIVCVRRNNPAMREQEENADHQGNYAPHGHHVARPQSRQQAERSMRLTKVVDRFRALSSRKLDVTHVRKTMTSKPASAVVQRAAGISPIAVVG